MAEWSNVSTHECDFEDLTTIDRAGIAIQTECLATLSVFGEMMFLDYMKSITFRPPNKDQP